MANEAVDVLPDQLLTPLLSYLQAAINADVGAIMVDRSGTSLPAVGEVLKRPQGVQIDPDNTTRLSCYRTKSKRKRVTFGHVDHIATLRFDYVSPSCGTEQLDDRWPLLDTVWDALTNALEAGEHEAWNDGASVFDAAGITFVDIDTAQKVEAYAEGGEFVYPMFMGTVDVRWRKRDDLAVEECFPLLSVKNMLYVDGGKTVRDVASISFTPLGAEAQDAQPFESEAELGGLE